MAGDSDELFAAELTISPSKIGVCKIAHTDSLRPAILCPPSIWVPTDVRHANSLMDRGRSRHNAIPDDWSVCSRRSVWQRGSGRPNITVHCHQWDRRNGTPRVVRHCRSTQTAIHEGVRDRRRQASRGTGNATHLGRFTLIADFTVTRKTGDATGTATWTAANGDQIFVDVFGHGDIVVFPTVTIAETHTITGGTGRFADASGEIDISRSADIVTGVSSGSLSGHINLGH